MTLDEMVRVAHALLPTLEAAYSSLMRPEGIASALPAATPTPILHTHATALRELAASVEEIQQAILAPHHHRPASVFSAPWQQSPSASVLATRSLAATERLSPLPALPRRKAPGLRRPADQQRWGA